MALVELRVSLSCSPTRKMDLRHNRTLALGAWLCCCALQVTATVARGSDDWIPITIIANLSGVCSKEETLTKVDAAFAQAAKDSAILAWSRKDAQCRSDVADNEARKFATEEHGEFAYIYAASSRITVPVESALRGFHVYYVTFSSEDSDQGSAAAKAAVRAWLTTVKRYPRYYRDNHYEAVMSDLTSSFEKEYNKR